MMCSGPLLGSIYRNSGVLFLDDASQSIVEREIAGQRKNVGTWHHDFADGDVFQFQGVMDHFFLEGRDLAELSAGGHDQLEFVRRVDWTLANFRRTEYPQNRTRRPAHHEE